MITCIQESAISSQTGELIKLSAEEFMLETDILLTLETVNWDIVVEYVIPSWFGHLAKVVSAQELDIKDNFDIIALLCKNNDYIMLQFINRGYCKQELYILNQMRIFLHAINLSDNTISDRLAISQNAFLLLSSNSLREEYEGPLSPSRFTKKQR